MIITYRQRRYIDKYSCIDTPVKAFVQAFAFSQGDLLYYRKNAFDYLVIGKNELIREDTTK